MINAIFNQPNFLVASKALDATVMREGAIANNIANLETPGYKRLDIEPSFEASLDHAITSGDTKQISSLQPTLAVDTTAKPSSLDGNTVHLENELMQMNQTAMTHSLETQLIGGMFSRMQMAITGKD